MRFFEYEPSFISWLLAYAGRRPIIDVGCGEGFLVRDVRAAGGNISREPGPVKGGSTVIAFITDPDGYKVELIERADNASGGGLSK